MHQRDAPCDATRRDAARTRARHYARTSARRVVLLKQLNLKFGRLCDAQADRGARASAHELDGLAKRILTATDLDDVFASE